MNQFTDIPSIIRTVYAADSKDLTAGGSGDNTQIKGEAIDRLKFFVTQVAVNYNATLSASETLSLNGFKLQHSDTTTDGDFVDYVTLADDGVIATETGKGTVIVNVDLDGAKKYIRVIYTPDLSATDTDTATIFSTMVLAGGESYPETSDLIRPW